MKEFFRGFEKQALDQRMMAHLFASPITLGKRALKSKRAGRLLKGFQRFRNSDTGSIVRYNKNWLSSGAVGAPGMPTSGISERDAHILSNFTTVIRSARDPKVRKQAYERMKAWYKKRGFGSFSAHVREQAI